MAKAQIRPSAASPEPIDEDFDLEIARLEYKFRTDEVGRMDNAAEYAFSPSERAEADFKMRRAEVEVRRAEARAARARRIQGK